ncbi:MAG: hypothetical protein LPJ98_12310 [Cyclobacteriaceae bacterium]|nr:hypothetical protein [Cyclobacteriaceae bacterium]
MIPAPNQNPEQIARDLIDNQLEQAGWLVQSKSDVNLAAGRGIAVREYQTSSGPADYVLFVDRKPVGIIEAKREEESERLTTVEDQSHEYATSNLKYLNHGDLPFVYESTGALTRFTRYRTNIHHTLKKGTMKLEDLQDFFACYNPSNRHKRTETYSDSNPECRWRKFSYEEIIARDKTNLDIFWLKDKSLADLDNLPDPDELAEEIIEDVEAALDGFRGIMEVLNK